jgi:DNA invertase Pin-like site-specific DNA recombinase
MNTRSKEELLSLITKKQGRLVDTYVNAIKPVTIDCGQGHNFQETPLNLKNGKWCPHCSVGGFVAIVKICTILDEFDVPYVKNYTLADVASIKYDVAIEMDPVVLIDYDKVCPFQEQGKPLDRSGEELQSAITQKVKAALDNDCRMIRIDADFIEGDIETLRSFIYNSLGSSDVLCLSQKDKYWWLNLSDIAQEYPDPLPNMQNLKISPSSSPAASQLQSPVSSQPSLPPILSLTVFEEEKVQIQDVEVPVPAGFGSVVAYIRVSTTEQSEKGYSMESQEERIRDYAKFKNFIVRKVYRDGGISGKEMSNRPALVKMMSELKSRDHVVVLSLSRLARNLEQAIQIEREIREKRAFLVALDLNIDTQTSIGRLIFQVISSVSEFERNQTSERTSLNLNYLSSQKKLRPRPPFGMKSPGKGMDFVRDEEEQKVISRIRELRSQNPTITLASMCRQLDKEMLPCRNAKKWYSNRLKIIMIQNNITEES